MKENDLFVVKLNALISGSFTTLLRDEFVQCLSHNPKVFIKFVPRQRKELEKTGSDR